MISCDEDWPVGNQENRFQLRLASDSDVTTWSFGRVTRADDAPGGLFDPRIFGHSVDYQCACGKVSGGSEVDGTICPDCGVSVGLALRQQTTRCGHIQLEVPLEHPWRRNHHCSMICVIPVGLRSQGASKIISDRYARILEVNRDLCELVQRSGRTVYHILGDPMPEFEERQNSLRCEYQSLVDGDTPGTEVISLSKLLCDEIRSLGSAVQAYLRGIGIGVGLSVRM